MVLRVVGISGSLRKSSTNTGLLRYAGDILKQRGVEFSILEIGHLPLMNEDLEINGLPSEVESFKQNIIGADAVIIACPEYNYSVSPALKNALDWGSRKGNCWDKKPAAIMGAGGGFGTGRGQFHLRQIMMILNLMPMNKEVCVRRFVQPSPFDQNGNVIDPSTQEKVSSTVDALLEWQKLLSNTSAL